MIKGCFHPCNVASGDSMRFHEIEPRIMRGKKGKK